MHGTRRRFSSHSVRRVHGPGASLERSREGTWRHPREHVRQRFVHRGRTRHRRARRTTWIRSSSSSLRTTTLARTRRTDGRTLPTRSSGQQLHGSGPQVLQRQNQGRAVNAVSFILRIKVKTLIRYYVITLDIQHLSLVPLVITQHQLLTIKWFLRFLPSFFVFLNSTLLKIKKYEASR